MSTFAKFIENRLLEVAPPPMPAGGISTPGSLPPPPMGGPAGAPPMPGGGMPPPMGGLGGGMPPPMGGGMPPAGGPQTAPDKLKAYNVWDVLERVLGQ